MLTGVIPATRNILARAGMGIRDFGASEINEAFAPVVLAWAREFDPDIGAGQPLRRRDRPQPSARLQRGATDDHAAEHAGAQRWAGLQTMCEGGGMANATVIERLG
jgi:acetyl-CoA acyltransferase